MNAIAASSESASLSLCCDAGGKRSSSSLIAISSRFARDLLLAAVRPLLAERFLPRLVAGLQLAGVLLHCREQLALPPELVVHLLPFLQELKNDGLVLHVSLLRD